MSEKLISASADVKDIKPVPGSGKRLAKSAETREWILGKVNAAAYDLRAYAPVRTGAGRRSIAAHVEMGSEGWYGWASWDKAHYYMGILASETHWADPARRKIRFV